MVTIAHFYEQTQAHLVKAFLEGSGIECFLLDENMATIGLYTKTIGGFRLSVCKEDEIRALEALEIYYRREADKED